LGISPDGITGKMDFTNDMGGDSLDMVEMIYDEYDFKDK
jgi:acyl carrier protein